MKMNEIQALHLAVAIATAVVCAKTAFADAPQEGNGVGTNRMIRAVIRRTDPFDGCDDLERVRPRRNFVDCRDQDTFFGAWPVEGWSEAEKRAAFDAYLETLAATNYVRTYDFGPADWAARLAREDMIDAVSCCWRMKYGNAAPVFRRLALLPGLGNYRYDIIGAALDLGGVDDDTTDFVETVVTNAASFSRIERGRALWRYEEKLLHADLTDEATSNACGRAVAMYYRNRKLSVVGADCFDPVLTSLMPGYANSSNRLDTAMFILSQTNCSERLNDYFSSVTNQLLSTGAPLQWIEDPAGE